MRRGKGRPVSGRHECGWSAVNLGADYSAEESAFLTAVAAYKATRHKQHLDCRDVLAIAWALGYRRVEAPRAPRPPRAPED